MGDVVSLHHDLAWYNLHNQQHNENLSETDNNWLRGGTATTPNTTLKPNAYQQAHALSMIANLATEDGDLEQLVIG